MKKFLLLLSGLFLIGCAQNPHLVYVFPPRDSHEPLIKIPVLPGKTRYEVAFVPKYPLLYDVKLNVRPYGFSTRSSVNVRCAVRIYHGDTLIGTCQGKLEGGLLDRDRLQFYFCSMDSLRMADYARSGVDRWTFLHPAYERRFLRPRETYRMVVTFSGDLKQFFRDFSPVTMEVSRSSLNSISM